MVIGIENYELNYLYVILPIILVTLLQKVIAFLILKFTKLLDGFNHLEGTGFANLECLMTNMFSKVVDSKLKCGIITEEEISSEYDDFSDMLIYSKTELISMYPHHDYSSLTGFENVKKTLDEVIVNTENKEVEFVK